MKYGIVLKKKQYIHGLTQNEMVKLYDFLGGGSTEAFPLEFDAGEAECSAIGLITPDAASHFDYDYKNSGLKDFVSAILDNANIDCNGKKYSFQGIDLLILGEE